MHCHPLGLAIQLSLLQYFRWRRQICQCDEIREIRKRSPINRRVRHCAKEREGKKGRRIDEQGFGLWLESSPVSMAILGKRDLGAYRTTRSHTGGGASVRGNYVWWPVAWGAASVSCTSRSSQALANCLFFASILDRTLEQVHMKRPDQMSTVIVVLMDLLRPYGVPLINPFSFRFSVPDVGGVTFVTSCSGII